MRCNNLNDNIENVCMDHSPLQFIPRLRKSSIGGGSVTTRPWIARYSFAAATTIAALVISLLFYPVFRSNPFLAFFASVSLSAWYGGFGPGLFVSIAAIPLVNYFFLSPTYVFSITETDLLRLFTFMFVSGLMSLLHQANKRTEKHLQQANERIKALQAITAAFAEAMSPQQIAQVVLSKEFAVLGSHMGIVLVTNTATQTLDMLVQYGTPPFLIDQFRRIPMNIVIPLTDAVHTGKPIWLSTQEDYRQKYPHLAAQLPADTNSKAIITLPLKAEGRILGAVALHFPHPMPYNDDDFSFLMALVQQCGQALSRANLYSAEAAARQEAEKANEAKLKFLATISHELRTPLTSIKGFASTLLSEDVTFDPADQREYIRIINEESDNLTELVEQLLDLSRLQAGSLGIEPQLCDFRAVIQAAREPLQAIAENHPLTLEVPPEIMPLQIDSRRIIQVLLNLVENAAKYSPPNSEIALKIHQKAAEIQVDVADKGIGIPPDQRTLVFEAFRQVERHELRTAGGAGLGLAICKGLIEAHDGRIWIQERSGPGTTISFTLPIPVINH
jgi:K+-sensing histidine kinase KdpD